MKQGLKQLPRQSLTLTPYLQNQIKLLALPGEEVRKKLGELINEFCEEEKGKDFFLFSEIEIWFRFLKCLKKLTSKTHF